MPIRVAILCALMVFSQNVAPSVGDFDPRSMTLAQIQHATGVQGNPTLANESDLKILKPGIYENMNIEGRVTIASSNVTLRNNRIKGDIYYAVLVDPRESPGEIFTNIVIENNDISGSQNCIAGNFTVARRNDLSRCENGINLWAENQEVVENYIHIGDYAPSDEPHFDGIENNGASGMKVIRNYVVLSSGQTAAIMMNNAFGSISSALIDGNYLAGGGYTIFCDNRKSRTSLFDGSKIIITNNTVKTGFWGHLAAYTSGCFLNAKKNKLIK